MGTNNNPHITNNQQLHMTQTMKKILVTFIFALLLLIALFMHHHNTAPKTPAIPPISVRVEQPIQKNITQSTTLTGSLLADKSTIITPRASGYIKTISFQEGQTVKTGQILFQLDSQTQQNALTAATARYDLSKLEFERNKTFLKKGFITQDMYYSSKVTLKQNQATLQDAQTDLAHRTITAPFNGAMGGLSVSIGDYVNPGNKLTTLVDNHHLRVEYAVPAKYANQIQINQPVTIIGENKENTITAKIAYISPSIETDTQTISVHANINNATQLFKPGEFVTILQPISSQIKTLLVPEQSVLASIDGYYVFIVKNKKAIKTPVKIGEHIDGHVIIQSGLSPNDNIIIAGENGVKNGEKVTIV